MNARRALLIGCPAEDLPGVAESVDAMARLLGGRHAFAVLPPVVGGSAATILRAFVELLEATGPGDAVVIYYAGHGSVFRDAPRDDRGRVRHTLIKASDVHESELDDFRGFFGAELSVLIQALTARTNNVTVILDCCYAADLVRLDDLGLDDPRTRDHIDRLRRAASSRRGPLDDWDPGPRAVVIAASASGGRSFPDPEREILLFTHHLVRELDRADNAPRRTWQEIVLAVRQELQACRRAQLPGVAGARFRLPFSTDVGEPGPEYHVATVRKPTATIGAGSLAGIREGERFELVVFGWGERRRGYRVAEAVARAVTPSSTVLNIEKVTAHEPLPRVLHARRLERRRLPLALDADAAAALGQGGAAARLFPEWEVGEAKPVAQVRWNAARNAVDVHDHDGELVTRVRLPDPAAHRRVGAALDRVARWWSVSRAVESAALPALGDCFVAFWGLLRQASGSPERPSVVEELLDDDDRVAACRDAPMFVRLENTGIKRALYARVYRVRVDRAIVPWEDSDHGVCVLRADSGYLGRHSVADARGLPLDWPADALPDLPHGTCGREHVLLLLSDAAIPRDVVPCDEPEPDGRIKRRIQRFAVVTLPYRLEYVES